MSVIFNCTKCGEKIIISHLKPGEISKCKICGCENIIPDNKSIQVDKQSEIWRSTTNNKTDMSSFKKYPALYSISTILKYVAYIDLILSISILIFGLTLLGSYDKSLAIMIISLSIYFGLFSFILILAFSELIKLFIDIEKNTRK
ncbi:MAG: hypothetical protein RAO94_14130 [Candidatus Stygibacter australis]|nr:hypothetical protein [Candidatus Stygibacter australis]MDP8323480.1 hypothetical protein [Candidatus Stygibacter australis]